MKDAPLSLPEHWGHVDGLFPQFFTVLSDQSSATIYPSSRKGRGGRRRWVLGFNPTKNSRPFAQVFPTLEAAFKAAMTVELELASRKHEHYAAALRGARNNYVRGQAIRFKQEWERKLKVAKAELCQLRAYARGYE